MDANMEEADANMEEANRGNLSLLPAWLYGYAQYILFVGVVLVILAVSKTCNIVLPYVPDPIRNVGNRLCLALWPFLTKIPAVRVLVTCLKRWGLTKEPKVGLCVIAADQHTLTTIAEQVREATDGFYKVETHHVTNRTAVAELPIYTRAICCVRNAERNISFNNQGDPEPDADLGFRAFDRMEAYTRDKSGVLLLMFDHAESQGIPELHSMAGINPSPRLSNTAQNGRFLTVYRQLSRNQKEFISKWATL